MLSDNREFYDLCRKYKYYYNAYQEVKYLEEIYWSKYFQEIYKEILLKLTEVEKEIIYSIFDELLGEYPLVSHERIFDDWKNDSTLSLRPLIVKGEKITIENEKFIKIMKDYMDELM